MQGTVFIYTAVGFHRVKRVLRCLSCTWAGDRIRWKLYRSWTDSACHTPQRVPGHVSQRKHSSQGFSSDRITTYQFLERQCWCSVRPKVVICDLFFKSMNLSLLWLNLQNAENISYFGYSSVTNDCKNASTFFKCVLLCIWYSILWINLTLRCLLTFLLVCTEHFTLLSVLISNFSIPTFLLMLCVGRSSL